MDDLISREAVVDTIYKRDERLQRYKEYRDKGDRIDLLGVLPEIHDIPPAFHGMTNGEVVKAVFPSFTVEINSDWVACWINPHETIGFDLDWWNSPYKTGE